MTMCVSFITMHLAKWKEKPTDKQSTIEQVANKKAIVQKEMSDTNNVQKRDAMQNGKKNRKNEKLGKNRQKIAPIYHSMSLRVQK